MTNFILSYFEAPIRNVVPKAVCSVSSLHKFITENPYLREVTERVRKDLHNPSVYKLKKTTLLPYITPNGVFSCRNDRSLIVPSGLFVIDIDHLESEKEAAYWRDCLARDRFLTPTLTFISPSTRGIKMLVPYAMNPDLSLRENLRENMEAAWDYLAVFYHLEADRANADLSRSCLLCHDKQARFNYL